MRSTIFCRISVEISFANQKFDLLATVFLFCLSALILRFEDNLQKNAQIMCIEMFCHLVAACTLHVPQALVYVTQNVCAEGVRHHFCLHFCAFSFPFPSPSPSENMQYPVYEGSPYRRLYHLGVKRNIQHVFGRNVIKALLPVFSRYTHTHSLTHTLTLTHTLSHSHTHIHTHTLHSEGDGTSFPLHISCTGASQINHNTNDRGTRDILVEAGHTSDSEVEIFTSGSNSETQPLTQNSQL